MTRYGLHASIALCGRATVTNAANPDGLDPLGEAIPETARKCPHRLGQCPGSHT